MAESVGLPLLVEVAKPTVEVVMGRVTEEMRSIVGFRRKLTNLQKKIRIIQGIVDSMTAAPAPLPNAAVEDWLKDTIRIIREAEDMTEELAYYNTRSVVMRRRRLQNNNNNNALFSSAANMKRLVSLPLKRVYLRTKMGRWIRRINSKIEGVRKEAQFINDLKALERSASASTLQRTAASNTTTINSADDQQHQSLQQVRLYADTSFFVGRDSDVKSVVNMLTKPDDQFSGTPARLSVLAIVGLGGMGKTTLARNIYKDDVVLSHFSERIWISDLKTFDIKRILNEMVKCLEMSTCEDINEVAISKLYTRLGGKRYLLVLDDVWDTNQDLWESLRNTLESIGGSKDSMVLTTTRSDDVAVTMHAYLVHHLSGLSKDDSWSLFEQIAFANKSKEEALALKETGQKIMEKCQGVPLAIRSIAGLLHKKRNLYEWTLIEKSELWNIPHHETGILPSLKLSYNYLCPMLKKCFSLCALSSKGQSYHRYEFICRWTALGLIQKSHNENITAEDIGEQYLNELLSISFLQVYEVNDFGEAVGYQMHDLIYDLARSIAMHDRLYLEASEKENEAFDIQHLTIIKHVETTSDLPDNLEPKNIRSLHTYNLPRGLLGQAKYLRVLYIGHSTIEVVPESIATLKCLKFLDLTDNPIKVLSDGIMELYNLQSLFLYKCKPIFMIPGGLSNLVNLRHLGLSFHFCPTKEGMIGRLSELQTVPPLQLSEVGFQICELGCLDHVKGTLDIKGLELIKSKLEAEKSKLSMKPRVEQLRLSWDSDDNFIKHEEVLDGLYPSPNLKVLSIKGYGGDKFPSWLMNMNVSQDHNNGNAGSLFNLIKIELVGCGRCQQLPTLGHLPRLKAIEITNMENLKQIGPEFYGGGYLLSGNSNQASSSNSSLHEKSMVHFASLKELRLKGLGKLEEWWESGLEMWSGFPSLEVLVIENCQNLRKAPNKFPNLRELILKEMISSQPLRNIFTNKTSLSCLKKLDIQGIQQLAHIPEEVDECTSLQTLHIESCPVLTRLPDSLSKLLSLEVLEIYRCPNLTSVPNVSSLGCLRELILFRNDGLVTTPEGLQSCKSLEILEVVCCAKVETLPDLSGLSRLFQINMRGITKMITSPPDWIYTLPLTVMHIGRYDELNDEFPDIGWLLNVTHLRSLFVFGWEKLQSVPEQLQHFTAVTTLLLFDFVNVEQLPDWLRNLTSLTILHIGRCKKLKKLPSMEALNKLSNFKHLDVEDSPLLEEAVDKDGAEYHKIASCRIKVEIKNSTP